MLKKRKLIQEEMELCGPMLRELRVYERAGIPIVVDGENMSAQDAAKICMVLEKGSYMGDYITDERGRLTELHFDKVKVERTVENS